MAAMHYCSCRVASAADVDAAKYRHQESLDTKMIIILKKNSQDKPASQQWGRQTETKGWAVLWWQNTK